MSEVINPFYIFQVASMALWFWDGYVIYAWVIFAISFLSIVENLYETVSNSNDIRELAKYECQIKV